MSSETIRLIRKLALIGLIIGIVGNGVLYVKGISPFNLVTIDQSYPSAAANIENLEVITPSDNIVVTQSLDGIFHFRIVGQMSLTSKPREIEHQMTSTSDTLIFKMSSSEEFQFGYNFSNLRLEVSVPKKHMKQINIKSDSGNISINDIQSDIIQLDNGSGNINTQNAAGKLRLTNRSGDIQINLNKIDQDISFTNRSGYFKLNLALPPSAVETNLTTKSGEIRQNLPNLLINESSDREKQQSGILGVDGPKIVGSTKSGDITIKVVK